MPLIVEQQFPLGRFNATRWHQNPFEDPFGEWPPSPLRLLRALTARWFQYARETDDSDTFKRDALLRDIASELPSFALPSFTWRGQPLKQYVPYGVEWTAPGAADAAYKKAKTTLTEDHYRVLSPDARLFWHWENLEVDGPQKDLLDQLLKRILYFGRAESFSCLRRVNALPSLLELNCRLSAESADLAVPVLAQIPNEELNLPALLSLSDDKELCGRSIPPNTAWFYAKLPDKPAAKPTRISRPRYPTDLNCLQFAVGGVVYPAMAEWVKVTERFRGTVIRHMSRQLTGFPKANYHDLTPVQRDSLSLITGKDSHGEPMCGHRHAFFFLWPGPNDSPGRLIAWRKEPFTDLEIDAMLRAADQPVRWGYDLDDWAVRFVPLPFNAAAPAGLFSTSRAWISVTPFVPPASLHRFRKNGRPRDGESPENVLRKLLQKKGMPPIEMVKVGRNVEAPKWVTLHETRDRRMLRQQSRTRWARPGFWLRIEFSDPVSGPLFCGDSCHFGLGAFKSAE